MAKRGLFTLKGAQRARLPQRAPKVQLAMPAEEAPEGDRWLHEIKLDGYRMLCRIDGSSVRFWSRNGKDWTDRLQALVPAIKDLSVDSAILDGEVAVVGPDGVTSFQALQNAFREGAAAPLTYFVFDLLHMNGYDLQQVSLERRKGLLQELLAGDDSRIRFSEHIAGNGPTVFGQACRMGLEGIVSKRRDRPHRPGRTPDWQKVKCLATQEFVVAGFTQPSGSRSGFGALLLGYFDDADKLRYAGRVGTGFTEQTLVDLHERLQRLRTEECPFADLPAKEGGREVTWAQPQLVAQVEYTGWTESGHLRHPSYRGLREDKRPEEVMLERSREIKGGQISSAAPAQLRMTHPERVLFPEQGLTKFELARYYAEIADWILPHIVGRPLTLLRAPEGRHKQTFYQRNPPAGLPDSVKRVSLVEETAMVVDDLAGLLALVQFGTLEIHVWGSRADKPEKPDRLAFDLDPDPELPWRQICGAAESLRQLLSDLGLQSFVKTTGGKGLHVVVPVTRRHDWSEARQFAEAVAKALASETPGQYTASMSKAARKGKVYVDFRRNGRGTTTVAPYSTRARSGAPVSVPVAWDELETVRGADAYTVGNVRRRLVALEADPWDELPTVRQSITARMRTRLGL